jgi:hypothetical protein
MRVPSRWVVLVAGRRIRRGRVRPTWRDLPPMRKLLVPAAG